jgi:hypothetical protein
MANETTSTEELEKQRQMQQQQEMMQRRMFTIQQICSIIQNLDPSTVLKTFGQYGINFICPNPQISYALLTGIYQKLIDSEPEESLWADIFNALNASISRTNQMRYTSYGVGMPGMNPMMGMGMPGMNPMMGMGMGMGMPGMNPMMGMGMMNPMMGMGMGMPGMSQPANNNQTDNQKIEGMKNFIKQNLQPNYMGNNVDPIVFIQLLGNYKVELDFSEDKEFSYYVIMAIQQAVGNMPSQQLVYVLNIIYGLYNTEMQKNYSKNGGKNNQNGMNPMMMGMGMMNPMMGGMPGMNPMMGMGMMNPMMGGMNTMFDQSQSNNMMGMGMMNPMMGMGMGMPGMNPMMGMGMPGMNMNMPGMQNAQGTSSGMVW